MKNFDPRLGGLSYDEWLCREIRGVKLFIAAYTAFVVLPLVAWAFAILP